MSKTIYLHIGAHKTGTTAIQRFLTLNRDNLKKKGYLYPGNKSAHHVVPHTILNTVEKWGVVSFKNDFNILREEVNGSGFEKIILSSEDFEHLKDKVSELKDFFSGENTFKIIYYVRRQDDMIESMYNEAVKSPISKYKGSFSEYYNLNYDDHLYDYSAILESWKNFFGEENIIIRVYEDEQLPKGIYHDFLESIGLELDKTFKVPKRKINPSWNWDLIEFKRYCNIHSSITDPAFNRFLIKILSEIQVNTDNTKNHLMSPQQRLDIINQYQESNIKIAREYLGRGDGKLFYSPLPNPDEHWESYEGLTLEKLIPIFTQILYNMDLNHRKELKKITGNTLFGKFCKYIRQIEKGFKS